MKVRSSGLRRYLRSKLAYTLIEVVLALAVISIVGVTLYNGILISFDATRSERENLRATQILLRRMEGIRLFNWDQIDDPALNPPVFSERFLPGSPGVAASGIFYTGKVDVTAVAFQPAATYSTNMKKVTVTLTWSSGRALQTRSAFTYVARDGVQNYVYGQ